MRGAKSFASIMTTAIIGGPKVHRNIMTSKPLQDMLKAIKEYNDYIDNLCSLHKHCGPNVNWDKICSKKSPMKPEKTNEKEKHIQKKIDSYKPSFLDKTLRLSNYKRKRLLKLLEQAKIEDNQQYQIILQNYEHEYKMWKEEHELASRIVEKDAKAYCEAFQRAAKNFNIIRGRLNLNVSIKPIPLIEIALKIEKIENIIPSFDFGKSKRGVPYKKDISKKKYYDILQCYICSVVLRFARELFAFLPIKFVLINCLENRLNTQTGHMEDTAILSVIFSRNEIKKLNYDRINPVDAMNNFKHRLNFKKTKGLLPITEFKKWDINFCEDNTQIQSKVESRQIPKELIREEKAEVMREFDRKKLEELINTLIFAPMGKTAITLRESILEELDRSENKNLSAKTCRRLSKWCHTGGTYTTAMEIAREISILLFGYVIERRE